MALMPGQCFMGFSVLALWPRHGFVLNLWQRHGVVGGFVSCLLGAFR